MFTTVKVISAKERHLSLNRILYNLIIKVKQIFRIIFDYFTFVQSRALLTCLYKRTYELIISLKIIFIFYYLPEMPFKLVSNSRGFFVFLLKKNGLRSEGGKEELKPQPVVFRLYKSNYALNK